MQVGVVGFGNVGRQVARLLADGAIHSASLAAIAHTDHALATTVASNICPGVPVLPLAELVERCDIIVESATADAFPEIAKAALAGRDNAKTLIAVSAAGALQAPDLRQLIKDAGSRLIYANGMMPGLDIIRAAREGEIASVTLTTTLPPESLRAEPYVQEQGIILPAKSGQAVEVFRGSAREAAAAFPRHFNVAVALSLAGVGLDDTGVRISCDAAVNGARHHIELQSRDVMLEMTAYGVPSPDNLRTSRIVAPSILAAIRGLIDPIRIGG